MPENYKRGNGYLYQEKIYSPIHSEDNNLEQYGDFIKRVLIRPKIFK